MAKFKVGDKVVFVGCCNDHLRSQELKEIYDNKTILEISNVYEEKERYDVKGKIWNFESYELELAEDIIKVGDTVQPQSFCIGYPDYFRIVGIKSGCNISYDLEQLTFNGRTLRGIELVNWEKADFNVVPSIDCPMDTLTQQVLVDIKGKQLYQMYVDGKFENIIKKGEDKMDILEIYSKEAKEKINEKYDKLEKEVKDKDNVHKIIEEAENQINVLLDRDELHSIKLAPLCMYSEIFEPKTNEKLKKITEQRNEELQNLDNLLEKVVARLKICDNTEYSRASVLQIYGILDEEGKIAEYKIEKKGKK